MSNDLPPYIIELILFATGTVGWKMGDSENPATGPGFNTRGDRLGAWFFGRNTSLPKIEAQFSWNDFSVVPDGMSDFLTSQYIFVFGCNGTVPMQALYKTLRANGGGQGLDQLEAMAVQLGYATDPKYGLISIPSIGSKGVENSQIYTSGTTISVAAQMIAEGDPPMYSPHRLWP